MYGSKQSGFTLIELVVVIVILGVLSAFAVPRFMGMEGRARVATLNGMQGALKSAAAMAHGVWLADGTNAATVTIEGQSIAFVNGYPTRASILALMQDTTGFAYAAGTGMFTKIGAPTPANCYVQYTNAASTTAAPVVTGPSTLPAVPATTTGCGL